MTINQDVRLLETSYGTLRMNLSARTTQAVILGSPHKLRTLHLSPAPQCLVIGNPVPFSNSVTYLEVKIEGASSLEAHISSLRKKSRFCPGFEDFVSHNFAFSSIDAVPCIYGHFHEML